MVPQSVWSTVRLTTLDRNQGITFGAITIRIALHQYKTSRQQHLDSTALSADRSSEPTIQTIGSIPLRRLPHKAIEVNVDIKKDIREAYLDDNSERNILVHEHSRKDLQQENITNEV